MAHVRDIRIRVMAGFAFECREDLLNPARARPFWEALRGAHDPDWQPELETPAHVLYVCLTADTYVERWFLHELRDKLLEHVVTPDAIGPDELDRHLVNMTEFLGRTITEE